MVKQKQEALAAQKPHSVLSSLRKSVKDLPVTAPIAVPAPVPVEASHELPGLPTQQGVVAAPPTPSSHTPQTAQGQPRLEIKVDLDQLQQHKLFIGTPMYGGACGGLFSRSVADLSSLCTHYHIQLQLHFLFNESLITRARNYICDEFMRSPCDHLMFIDSDIGFDARDVLALMALQMQNADYDIIGGAYPKKTIAWEKVAAAANKGLGDKNPNDLERYIGDFVFNPKEGQNQIPLFQPVEVREVGTGFMMIRKEAFQKFAAAFPHYMYRPDHVRTQHFDGSREIMQYFQAEIDGIDFGREYKELLDQITNANDETESVKLMHDLPNKLNAIQERAQKRSKRYLSEDYWFNQKCQEIGVRTFLCPWMRLQHMGSYVFGGSLIDLAQAGASATADAGLIKKMKDQVLQKTSGNPA